jgi:hypothetical protein
MMSLSTKEFLSVIMMCLSIQFQTSSFNQLLQPDLKLNIYHAAAMLLFQIS